ncbi:MAG: hypothetical protein LBL62_12340 [Planctomycetaceae bacterium]|nr:hypothetical protein [Planctomycetaceae bacterium]
MKPDSGYTRTIKELQESGKIVDKPAKPEKDDNDKTDSESDPYTLRDVSLGKDPARGGKFVRREMIAALQLEDEIEIPLKRLQKNKGGDWIDSNGKIYDLIGPVPAKFVNEQLDQFIYQINIHDQKDIDVIVLDLSNFNPGQLMKIHEVIKTLKKEIIILNER